MKATKPQQPIEPDRLYTMAQLAEATDLGRYAIRQARIKGGLKVHYKAGKAWILGKNWIEFVTKEESK